MQYRILTRDLILSNDGDATAEALRSKVVPLTNGSRRTYQCFPLVGRCDVQVTSNGPDGTSHDKTFTTQIT